MAEDAWRGADAPLHCIALEFSGITGLFSYLNGKYYLEPSLSESEPPAYKQWAGAGERGLWLYYAGSRWHFGTRCERGLRWPSWRIRSRPCKPGTLPGAAGGFERLTVVGWLSVFIRIFVVGRRQLEAAWKIADATATCIQVELADIKLPRLSPGRLLTRMVGKYDIQPIESVLAPPVYRRRRTSLWDRELWLYYSEDGRWHVGTTADKNARRAARRLRSFDILRTPTGQGAMGPAGGATVSLPGAIGTWQAPSLLGWMLSPARCLPSCLCGGNLFWETPTAGWKVVNAKVSVVARAKAEDAWRKPKAEDAGPEGFLITSGTAGWRGCLGCGLFTGFLLGGNYRLHPAKSNRDAPSFMRRSLAKRRLWLYYARDGRWHLGTRHEMNERMPSWRLRSEECAPGKFPGEQKWETLSCLGWLDRLSRFCLGWKRAWERVYYVGWSKAPLRVATQSSADYERLESSTRVGRCRASLRQRASRLVPPCCARSTAGCYRCCSGYVSGCALERAAHVVGQGLARAALVCSGFARGVAGGAISVFKSQQSTEDPKGNDESADLAAASAAALAKIDGAVEPATQGAINQRVEVAEPAPEPLASGAAAARLPPLNSGCPPPVQVSEGRWREVAHKTWEYVPSTAT